MLKYPLKQSYRRITVRLRSENAEFLKHHPNDGVSSEIFALISEQFSAYKHPYDDRVELMLPQGHPDLAEIEKLALGLGLKLEPTRATRSQLEISDYYVPTASEISSAEFLEARMLSPNLDHCFNISQPRSVFACKKIKRFPNRQFGSNRNVPHLIYVRGTVKARLESAGLHGLKLSLVQTDALDDVPAKSPWLILGGGAGGWGGG